MQDGHKTAQEMQDAAEFDKLFDAISKGGAARESLYGASIMRSSSMHHGTVSQRVVKSIRGGGGKRYGDSPAAPIKLTGGPVGGKSNFANDVILEEEVKEGNDL